MGINDYKSRKNHVAITKQRETCAVCWKSKQTCFCNILKPFDSPVPFVIIQHLDEARNPIATARMSHLSIRNSTLIMDTSFEANSKVEELIADRNANHVILYPSAHAAPIENYFVHPASKPPIFWILDTKWAHVAKMLKLSPALQSLPMAKFTPETVSNFQIRKQPKPLCLSTIESMFLVIDRYKRFHQINNRDHESLLEVFQHMVNQQIQYALEKRCDRHKAKRIQRAAKQKTFAMDDG